MKKLLLGLLFFNAVFVNAKMTYDPATNSIFTLPLADDINQAEYWGLWRYCLDKIYVNIKGFNPSGSAVLQQFTSFLERVGSPTAKRLIQDLKENCMFYPDGSVAYRFIQSL